MKDNEIFQILIPIIKSGLEEEGLNEVLVNQSFMPTKEGMNFLPTVYFFKVYDHRYGAVGRLDYDSEGDWVHKEDQPYETQYQANCFYKQDPKNLNIPTASDLASVVVFILQSNNTLKQLISNNLSILKISDIRNPYYIDDFNQFSASANFDFTITHVRDKITNQEYAENYESKIYRI